MSETLREAQRQVLEYVGGPLAISAVPGAGKTFILTRLATRLIVDLGVAPRQILILTYMRSAAATFRRRIARALAERGGVAYGLQAMTIHACCLMVLKQRGLADEEGGFEILSPNEQDRILQDGLTQFEATPAAAGWRKRYPQEARRREQSAKDALRLISAAKYRGLSVAEVESRLGETQPEVAFLYRQYDAHQRRHHVMDYDDLIHRAIALLRADATLLGYFQQRFHYVLEDEAQDSTPAQQELLTLLTDPSHGGRGHLVRVGDPNQAISGTFTFNDPRFFRSYCEERRREGKLITMDEASRSAPEILDVANDLVAFVGDQPVPALARSFMLQRIRPACEGPSNPKALGWPTWTLYPDAETERDRVLAGVRSFLQAAPEATAAILLRTGQAVEQYRDQARRMGLPLHDAERPTLETAPVLAVLEPVLGMLGGAWDQGREALMAIADTYLKVQSESWEAREKVLAYLLELPLEALVFPPFELAPTRPGELPEGDYAALLAAVAVLREAYATRHLAPEDQMAQVALTCFGKPQASLVAAKAMRVARRTLVAGSEGNPYLAWQREIRLMRQPRQPRELLGQEAVEAHPLPGKVQIMTIHKSKGAEFEAVWVPALGLRAKGIGHFPLYPEQVMFSNLQVQRGLQALSPEGPALGDQELRRRAQDEEIAEALRLLYVAITRAERALHLSAAHEHQGGDPAAGHVMHLAHLMETRAR